MGGGNRISSLNPSMFAPKSNVNKFASFNGKAAESHALIAPLAEVCRSISDGSEYDQIRLRALDSLETVFRTFRNASMFLTETEYQIAKNALDEHFVYYGYLASKSLEGNRMHYQVITKTHYLWHIVDHSRFLNPRFLWAFDFEDFMGQMVMAAKACLAGSKMSIVGDKVLVNYCLVFDLNVRARARNLSA